MIVRSGNHGVLHQVSKHAGLLYIGGVAPDDPALDMAGQTRQMLEKLDAVLTAHGSDRLHVLMMYVFITDMCLKPEMNRVWTEFFPPDHLPSRITLGIDAIEENVLIEASTVAVRRQAGASAPR